MNFTKPKSTRREKKWEWKWGDCLISWRIPKTIIPLYWSYFRVSFWNNFWSWNWTNKKFQKKKTKQKKKTEDLTKIEDERMKWTEAMDAFTNFNKDLEAELKVSLIIRHHQILIFFFFFWVCRNFNHLPKRSKKRIKIMTTTLRIKLTVELLQFFIIWNGCFNYLFFLFYFSRKIECVGKIIFSNNSSIS